MTKELEGPVLEGEIVEPSVTYHSNNSGGGWWLSDDDWRNLEKAGWKVRWFKDDGYYSEYTSVQEDGRWLGALAGEATRKGLTLDEAIREWEEITGERADDEGCPCCGSPHGFYEG